MALVHSSSSPESGPRESGTRKKMRKGTRSCFECRRRKIRCIFPSDNPNVCTECFARGSRCVDQEHAEVDVVVDHRKNLRERVARLESMVESLVDDKTQKSYNRSEEYAAEALRSLGTGANEYPNTPRSEDTMSSAGGFDNGKAPLLSLFDNAVLTTNCDKRASTGRSTNPTDPPAAAPTYPSPAEGISLPSRPCKPKDHTVRQALLAVLPPYDKLLILLKENNHVWILFQRKCIGTRGESETFEQFAIRVLTRGTPCEHGMLLLLYGSCIEGEVLDQCLAAVDQLIIQDDDYAMTLEGLECCIFQGKIYADIGQARRSWLTVRRGLTHAQLLGLHRNHAVSGARESIWWNLYGTDRLTSLMLGMPYGIADAHCNLDVMGQPLEKSVHPQAFFAKVCLFAGRVVDRSQGLHEATYSSALDLEEEMNAYGRQMPNGWWDVGVSPSDCDDPTVSYGWQDKILTQIAFHQVKSYLHIPFMLKSATNASYESSRTACFESSREMLRLYHTLRSDKTPYYSCKAIDFIAFTACVLIVLGLIGYGRKQNQEYPLPRHDSDWQLIERSMDIFQRASSEKGGKVAAQSYAALAQMHQVKEMDLSGTEPNETAKIVVPFFGTILIQRGKAFRHVPSRQTSTNSPNTPESQPSTTSGYGDAPQRTTQTYNAVDPQVMYDGFYMPQSNFDPQLGDDSLSHFAPTSGLTAYDRLNGLGNMDIDQDWSWFMNDVQLQQPQLHMQYTGM